jgi:hypothetical protein
MSKPSIDSILEEERRDERLLDEARDTANEMTKAGRRRLLVWLMERIEDDSAPPPSPPPPRRRPRPKSKIQNRDAIRRVLAGTALSSGDIVKAVKKIKPDAKYASVVAEISRMRGEGLITTKSSGAHALAQQQGGASAPPNGA